MHKTQRKPKLSNTPNTPVNQTEETSNSAAEIRKHIKEINNPTMNLPSIGLGLRRLRSSETIWLVRMFVAVKVPFPAACEVGDGDKELGFLLGFLGALGLYESLCWVSHEATTLVEVADKVSIFASRIIGAGFQRGLSMAANGPNGLEYL